MKKIFIMLVSVLFTVGVFAQAPQKMSYQGIIRDAGDQLVTSSPIGIQISILQGSESGAAVYAETQTPATNANGLISIKIGDGSVVRGDFSAINWANGPYFIETKTDPAGGTDYTITGTSQLMSVPYALYAKSSGTSGDKGPTGDKGLTGDQGPTGDPALLFDTTQVSAKTTWTSSKIKGELDLKASTTALNTGLEGKVDKVSGKGLSTEDYTTAEKTKVSNLSGVNTGDQDLSALATKAYVDLLVEKIQALEARELANGYTDQRDGNHYDVVKIGNQVWMADNLKYLPSVVAMGTGSSTIPYYYVYANSSTSVSNAKSNSNYATYGVLYNWPAVMNGSSSSAANPSGVQGVCPAGWHLPSDAEWTQLTDYLGGDFIAGDKLKESGTSHWKNTSVGVTNETGFTALPGGFRGPSGPFNIDHYGYWWSATDNNTLAWQRYIADNASKVSGISASKANGYSVRCIRD